MINTFSVHVFQKLCRSYHVLHLLFVFNSYNNRVTNSDPMQKILVALLLLDVLILFIELGK